MTNEEKKSNEIAAEYLVGHDRLEITYEEMREAVMTMAEWKDQQFKKYLENKIEPFIRTNASPQGTYQEGFDDGYTSAIDEIINELFGEEQIDNSENDE